MVMMVGLLQPRSRGSVRLRTADMSEPARIDLAFYQDPEDARRVADGVRMARRLAEAPALRDLLTEELSPGSEVRDAELEDAVRAFPEIYNHPVGSCRMGTADDSGAVVDTHCSLHGVEGPLVIDASVMPVSPRSTTHLPTLMLAARAVALNWPAARR